MKTKRIKATLVDTYEEARFEERRWSGEAWQLPAEADSYERMVEQTAAGIMRCWKGAVMHEIWRTEARAALRAIGITAPKRGKKGSK